MCLQCYQLVVDRRDKGFAHGSQGGIHLNDQRVLHTALRYQIVALQQLVVVVIDLRCNVRIVYTRICRKQLETVSLARQVVADIPCHVSLVVQRLNGGICFAGLCHVHIGGCLHIGQQVLALVGRNIVIHIAQLAFYHTESLIDEHAGTDGYLVLVLHPVLIIDGYEGIQHLLGTLDADILEGEGDDVGLLIVLRHSQSGRGGTYSSLDRGAHYLNFRFLSLPVMGSGRNCYLAKRALDGVAQLAFHLSLDRFSVSSKIVEGVTAFLAQMKMESGRLVVGKVCECHRYRQLVTVDGAFVEASLHKIVHLQVKSCHHLTHQVR